MTRQEIVTALVGGTWTKDDLEAFRFAIRDVNSRINTLAKHEFQAGDRVQFKIRKGKGEVVRGTIEKIMTKNIRVRADDGGGWRVSPSFLEKID